MIWEVRKRTPAGWVPIATTRSKGNADCICQAMTAMYDNEYQAIEVQNQRNAGRDPIFTDEDHAEILRLHEQGESMRAIAEKVGCSKSYVHKIINGQAKKG